MTVPANYGTEYLYGDDLFLYNFFSIAVLVKGRAIHLSYVDRRTDVFRLVYK